MPAAARLSSLIRPLLPADDADDAEDADDADDTTSDTTEDAVGPVVRSGTLLLLLLLMYEPRLQGKLCLRAAVVVASRRLRSLLPARIPRGRTTILFTRLAEDNAGSEAATGEGCLDVLRLLPRGRTTILVLRLEEDEAAGDGRRES